MLTDFLKNNSVFINNETNTRNPKEFETTTQPISLWFNKKN
uniref:Uncharacterized protein n=1 Tax=viral metagenome TaxID=1070528 RepID=A0A6C0DI24_9ZZZZ